MLRGFKKTAILPPGGSSTVSFTEILTVVWDADAHDWKDVSGTFKVYVGASSRDIRLTGSMEHTATDTPAVTW